MTGCFRELQYGPKGRRACVRIAGHAVVVIGLLLLGFGCEDDNGGGTTPDTTAPRAVEDLSVTTVTASSATLVWTAPGDDGARGTAVAYDIRYATGTITEVNWMVANSVGSPPVPQIAGSRETFKISGLASDTSYYFALKAVDDASNWAGLSNVASGTTASGNNPAPGELVLIPAGTFTMGSPSNEPGRTATEDQHDVTLTTAFHMLSTEVTNQQYADLAQWAYDNHHCLATSGALWDDLDGSSETLANLGALKCEVSFSGGVFSVDPGKENHPVKEVTWYGAARYCDWLSLREGYPRTYEHSGDWQCNSHDPYGAVGYRLPTEAEWEYACRAGTQTPFSTGTCLDAGTEANYDGNYPIQGCPSGPYVGRTVSVGSYPANSFGMYDLHGNLWEWCNDWYDTYGGHETDPAGPLTGSYRVLRGGTWNNKAQFCRSASRSRSYPEESSNYIGFRPVRSVSEMQYLDG